jgi:hypothetical protein
MKHWKSSITLLISVFVAVVFVSCSSKPYDDLQMVKTAMEDARSKEAYEYAPNDWDRALADWQMANSLIQMGRYDEAKSVLITAVSDFNNARDESVRRLEALKIEISNLQSVLKKGMETLQQASENSRFKSSLRKRVDASLPFIDEKIAIMSTALDDKQYMSARMYGHQALKQINNMEKELGVNQEKL